MRKTPWLLLAILLAVPGWAGQTSNNPAPAKKIVVSPGVMAGQKIGGDNPVYPAIAKAAGVQGTVVLHATISKEGTVENVKVISGPPMLQQASIDAIRTWRYRPYLLNGQPVEVETDVLVVFSLPPEQMIAEQSNGSRSIENAAALAASSANIAPEHPVTAQQVHEMLELTGALAMVRHSLEAVLPVVRRSLPSYIPDDVMQDFENSFLNTNLEDAIAKVYQAHISTEDAAVAIAFYKTPAGERVLAAQPAIQKELQAVGAQLGSQVMLEVMQRHKMEIQAAKDKYDQEHPWSAPKN